MKIRIYNFLFLFLCRIFTIPIIIAWRYHYTYIYLQKNCLIPKGHLLDIHLNYITLYAISITYPVI